jgi:prolyl oligopeptidase
MRLAVLTAFAFFLTFATGIAVPPETKKQPINDVYHGVTVQDDYRWLEDWTNKDVQKWSAAQNVHARAHLDRLPHVEAIRARVTKIMTAKTVGFSGLAHRNGTVFAIKREPPKQQPFLILMPALDALSKARVLVDPKSDLVVVEHFVAFRSQLNYQLP